MTDTLPPAAAPEPEDRPGAVLGPYTLVELLGQGGFGTVWVAEQERPVRRRVALKVVKAGMGSRDVLARFEAERQALAVMDHPGIAKVLDAGATPTGMPFFVMELVEGRRIVSFADHATLDVDGRLELFRAVCHAVQHAHQKGIVHRDLKPDNVLVADDDGRPVPRVIDFGIAKALETPLTETTLQTGAFQVMGTPAYMAPEQARRSADVDTRADVYSLGALLYELLCGARPFDFERQRTTTLTDVLRTIQEIDPAPPSRRLADIEHQQLRGVAAWRGTTPDKLAKRLRGDLDWIVMRALEKDPARRYATVAALADDVERHLRDEPVEAGPPSTLYRVVKLVRRHRGASVGAAAALLALIGAVGALAWSVDRVSEQRDAAELAREQEADARREAEDALAASSAVTDYLVDMLGQADPYASGRDVTVRDVLDRVAPSVGPRFRDRPVVEAELREIVGSTYRALGTPKRSREHLLRARELHVAHHGEDHPRVLTLDGELALLDWMEGRDVEALERSRLVHATLAERLGDDHVDTVEALNVVAIMLDQTGDEQGALALWEQVYAWRNENLGPDHRGTLSARKNVATAKSGLGRWDEAEADLQAVLDVMRVRLGEHHPDTLKTWNDVIVHFIHTSQWQRAVGPATELVAVRSEVLGPDHELTISSRSNLASIYQSSGRYAEAITEATAAWEAAERIMGPTSSIVLNARDTLGNAYAELERYDEAAPHTEAVYAARVERMGADHPSSLIGLQNLALLRRQQDDPAGAVQLLEELVERSVRVHGPLHPRTLEARHVLLNALHQPGSAAIMEPRVATLYDDCLDALGPDASRTVDVQSELAWTRAEMGRWEDAEEDFWSVHEARTELLGPDHELTRNALEGLAFVYSRSGRDAELAAVSRLLFAAARRRAESPDATPGEMSSLAWYLSAGPLPDVYDADEAVRWAEAANEATGYRETRYLDVLSDARHLAGDVSGALDAHRRALELLPLVHPNRRHHEARVEDLEAELAAGG